MLFVHLVGLVFGCDTYGEGIGGLWPPANEMVAPDTLVVAVRYFSTEPMQLVRDGDVVVPTTQVVFEDRMNGFHDLVVLTPDEPLEVGEVYRVQSSTGYGDWSFGVEEGAISAVDVPIPVEQRLASELLQGKACGGPERQSTARYDLCGDAPIYGVVLGDTPPAETDLINASDVTAFSSIPIVDAASGASLLAGDTGTVWFGAWNGQGQFSGWSEAVPFTMPLQDYAIFDRNPNAVGETCPDEIAWERVLTTVCDAGACDEVPPERAYMEPEPTGCQHVGTTGWLGIVGWLGTWAWLGLRRRA